MIVLRLQRIGKKREPHFRLVAQEKQKNPKSNSLEILGFLNPRSKEVQLKTDRIKYWLSVGAKPSATVNNLLIDKEIISGPKMKTVKVNKKKKDDKKNPPTGGEDKKESKAEAGEDKKSDEKSEQKPKDLPQQAEEKKEEVKDEKNTQAGGEKKDENKPAPANEENKDKDS